MTTPSAAPAPTPLRERFRIKDISYLTLPLLVMATFVEIVILATGLRYQQAVCVPAGLEFTFLGLGPIGALTLAIELLKLPLAIWTASRKGFSKAFMLVFGLPVICVLTFMLVKDMAVYEMTTAMKPATVLMEKAAVEEAKIARLNGELANRTKDGDAVRAFVDGKKAERDRKLAELAAKLEKGKADIEEALKRNDASRADALTLTDYQRKELSEVEVRQATLIRQSEADAAQLTKDIAELRARRETELARAGQWTAEEARIDNAHKSRLSYYTNRRNAYLKEKAEYDKATYLQRQVLPVPVDPGVPPERETNKLIKPTLLTELEEQIKLKETEFAAVSTRRRDGVARIEADARRIREDFDRRSAAKREEIDRKRDELLANLAALQKESAAESRRIDDEFNAAVVKERATLDGRLPLEAVRVQLDAARKAADLLYEERVVAIEVTQVHRLATTVEIVRGLLFGERPLAATATAKERGDVFTDRIGMVRIWVFPVLSFIVAFLPTLMVEVGFSTLFRDERRAPHYRLGFLGRGLHRLYIRAGRQKIVRAERLATEAAVELAKRDRALEELKRESAAALTTRDEELRTAREALAAAASAAAEEHARRETAFREETQRREEAWKARLAQLSEALNRAVLEKDELHDLQKAEVERQVRLRQDAWLERIALLRREIDDRRAEAETERAALAKEHREKLAAATDDFKTQVLLLRRQAADAEHAAADKLAKLTLELKEARHAGEAAEEQLKLRAEAFDLELARTREDAARELEKAVRDGEHRAESLRLDAAKTLRQREEAAELRLRRREQELTSALETRIAEQAEQAAAEAGRRESELEAGFLALAKETEERHARQLADAEEAARTRIRQVEQQEQARAAALLAEKQTQAELESRRMEAEFKRRLDTLARDAETRQRDALGQRERDFADRLVEERAKLEEEFSRREADIGRRHEQLAAERETRREQQLRQADENAQARLRQREQQLLAQAEQDQRRRDAEFKQELDARTREAEAARREELQRQELSFLARLKQRESELTARAETRERDAREQHAAELLAREEDFESRVRAVETRLGREAQQKDDEAQRKLRQREQQLQAQADARQAELLAQAEQEYRVRDQANAALRQREQELAARLDALAEERNASERKWEAEAQSATLRAEALVARADAERDEARKAAGDAARQVQSLEEKLREVSSLFTNWKGAQGK